MCGAHRSLLPQEGSSPAPLPNIPQWVSRVPGAWHGGNAVSKCHTHLPLAAGPPLGQVEQPRERRAAPAVSRLPVAARRLAGRYTHAERRAARPAPQRRHGRCWMLPQHRARVVDVPVCHLPDSAVVNNRGLDSNGDAMVRAPQQKLDVDSLRSLLGTAAPPRASSPDEHEVCAPLPPTVLNRPPCTRACHTASSPTPRVVL